MFEPCSYCQLRVEIHKRAPMVDYRKHCPAGCAVFQVARLSAELEVVKKRLSNGIVAYAVKEDETLYVGTIHKEKKDVMEDWPNSNANVVEVMIHEVGG